MLKDVTCCILLERLSTSVSNFPPQPGKVKIPHPMGMDDGKIPVGCRGGGGDVASS